MNQSQPEAFDDPGATSDGSAVPHFADGAETSEEELRAMLQAQVLAISCVGIQKAELPRVASFAPLIEAGTFSPPNKGDKQLGIVQGTDLLPDQDVLAMDATIPREPEVEPEELRDG